MAEQPDISTVEGRKRMKQQMLHALIHHMELERQTGDIEEREDSKLMAQARLSRKQYKEHAELVLELMRELE